MNITWLGHACFYLQAREGVWLTDPYHPKVGYPTHPCGCDLLTVSHGHYDHADTSWVQAGAVVAEPGEFSAGGFRGRAVAAFHDDEAGAIRGENLLIVTQVEGICVCHAGDLGHRLSDEQIAALGPVDVLLLPVGGHYTLDARGAAALMEQLQPKISVAMHFRTAYNPDFPVATEEEFARLTGARRLGGPTLTLSARTLADLAGAVVLDPLPAGPLPV